MKTKLCGCCWNDSWQFKMYTPVPHENPGAYLNFHNKMPLIRKMLINMSLLSNVHTSFLFLIKIRVGDKKRADIVFGHLWDTVPKS